MQNQSKVSFVALTLCLFTVSSPAWAIDSGAQFFTKLYTEALGRAPDAQAQENNLATLGSNGCNLNTATQLAQNVLLSSEFTKDYSSDNGSLVAGIYRAALNRDVDQNSFDNYAYDLNYGIMSESGVVNAVLGSAEFANLINKVVCVAPPSGDSGNYGWGGGQIFDRKVGTYSNTFTGTSEADLQSLLNSTGSGGKVYLNPGAAIALTSTLIIPSGVTLTTYGNPSTSQYLLMGRLYRASTFTNALVEVSAGASLLNTWVDGNRANLDASGANCTESDGFHPCLSVEILGGDNTVVSDNRLTDSDGWTNLVALGDYSGISCGHSVILQIAGNVSTQYATSHVVTSTQVGNPWSDGLSIECENANVIGNTVVDATDVGIVLFSSPSEQNSHISYNTIINNGNAAFGSIVVDTRAVQAPINGAPWVCSSNDEYTYNFSDAMVNDNLTYTSTESYVGIGISVGTKSFFAQACNGTGMTITGNSTGGHIMITTEGIAVSGMYYGIVTQNNYKLEVGQNTACPVGNAVADPTYSTNLYTDIQFTYQQDRACVGSNNVY